MALTVLPGLTACSNGNRGSSLDNASSDTDRSAEVVPFRIYWPLVDQESDVTERSRPLLHGELSVRTAVVGDRPWINLAVALIRPESEQDRESWNSRLEYAEHGWMRRLRVWDAEERWLYPNLCYLLKLHGHDRVQRYGGWDRGHAADNDFAAVLIRCFDSTGQQENATTADQPLVSAQWHAGGIRNATLRTIVHRANSDRFAVQTRLGESGLIKVWLIYADFFNHPPPDTWPREEEFNGGALAFFHLAWYCSGDGELQVDVRPTRPEPSGFDWEAWVGRQSEAERPVAAAKLLAV
jgi:hypothetical protein